MADSVIGALRVLLGVDTAAFSEGLTKAEKSLANFSKQFGTIAAGAAAAVAAAGVALAIGVQKSIDQADQLGKMAQKFGVPIEELSKLKFAAELSDVSLEALGKGLGRLSKALTEAAAKPTSEAANAFRALDISVRNADGSVKSSEQALLDIAGRFAELKDGAGKTAVSMALFGKAGADLIPLLNQGKTGIQALKDEAEKLGLVITSSTARSAEEFNDNLKRLNTTWSAVTTQLAAGAAGPLAEVSKSLVELQKNSNLAQNAGEFLGDAFKVLVQGVIIAAANFRGLARDIAAVWQFFKDVPVFGVTEAFAKFTETIKITRQELVLLIASFNAVNHETDDLIAGLAAVGVAAAGAAKPQKDFNFAAMGGKDALQSFFESTTKSLAAQQALALAVGSSAGAMAASKVASEALAIAEANHIAITGQRKDALIALMNAVGQAAEDMRIKELVQEAIPEWQKLQDKIVEIQEIMAQSPEKAKQLSGAFAKTQQDFMNLMATQIAVALGQFGQLFTTLGAHNKKLFEIGKGFAIAEAIVNTYKAANIAFASAPPPLSYVLMAAAIAAGIANVIKIQQTKFTGAALGGSFRVPGGVSGFDSKLVPMMLSPGERVDVTPASRAGEGSRELIISGIRPKDFYTGENMRELVLSLDKWMKDGGTGIRLATT